MKIPSKKKQKSKTETLEVHPNPSQNQLIISSKKLCNSCQLIISDINGRVLYTERQVKSESRLSITFNLDNGIYFINLIDETGYSRVKKFIVAK